MDTKNISMSRIEERARKIGTALKGLILYRQLRNQPAIQAFEDFIHGLVSDSVCAERLWDDYSRFVHNMMNALEETNILRYSDGTTLYGSEPQLKSSLTRIKEVQSHEDSLRLHDGSTDQPRANDAHSCETMRYEDNAPDTGCFERVWGDREDVAQGYEDAAGSTLWKSYWGYNILTHETPFSRYAEHVGFEELPEWLKASMEFELEHLREIALVDWEELLALAKHKTGIDRWLNIFAPQYEDSASGRGKAISTSTSAICGGINRPVPYHQVINWEVKELAYHFHCNGSGMFGIFKGFRWERVDGHGRLKGIACVDPVTLDQLVGYEEQKAKLIENTEQLLRGYRANNVLLYGDKGTGKSSLVKALVHRYAEQGLRIVEVPKECLRDYYHILEQLEGRKQKFILFVDDLSFEEGEVEYKHIKALLEGGLKARPANVVVYATSNRRHLVREFHSDRSGAYSGQEDEISPIDSMQEKLSLSDRFGITLTFTSPNQRTYLEMVERLAAGRGISMDAEALREEALRWEKRYNGRSGRTARQFIDYLEARLGNAFSGEEAALE
ncbi:MAG: ATP-binding protein [Clostridia bacterium]